MDLKRMRIRLLCMSRWPFEIQILLLAFGSIQLSAAKTRHSNGFFFHCDSMA